MEIKVKNKTIDFFQHDISEKNKVAVSTSSGTDSSLALYLTALCFPDRKIIPYHMEESQYPGQKPSLFKIVEYFNSILPNKNITEPLIDSVDYCTKGSKWKLEAIKTPGDLPIKEDGNTGQAKILASKYYEEKRFENGDVDYMVCGSTSNPPMEVLKDSNVVYEERRSGRLNPLIGPKHYLPFYHLDKSYIAEMWKKYNLMDIFKETISCIEYNNHGSKKELPCKKCYWCYEKFWAFGMYDGGIK